MTNHDLCKLLQDLEENQREIAHDQDMDPKRTANWEYAETAAIARSAILQQAEELEQVKAQANLTIDTLRGDYERLRWLIANGEKHFGTLWREATAADIDAILQLHPSGKQET